MTTANHLPPPSLNYLLQLNPITLPSKTIPKHIQIFIREKDKLSAYFSKQIRIIFLHSDHLRLLPLDHLIFNIDLVCQVPDLFTLLVNPETILVPLHLSIIHPSPIFSQNYFSIVIPWSLKLLKNHSKSLLHLPVHILHHDLVIGLNPVYNSIVHLSKSGCHSLIHLSPQLSQILS